MMMPDWKKPDDYAFVDKAKIGLHGVAWEFLRRNVNFVADFKSVHAGTFTDECGNLPKKSSILGLGINKVVGFPHPKIKKNESEAAWIKRCQNETGSFPVLLSPCRYVMRRWGLFWGSGGSLPDPAKNAMSLDPAPRFDMGDTPRILRDQEDWISLKKIPPEVPYVDLPINWDPSNVVVVFSVMEAPKKQWAKIRPTLSKLHKEFLESEESGKIEKSQEHTWIDALRAWDAEAANAPAATEGKQTMTFLERGQIIWPGQEGDLAKRYKNALERANDHVNGKYRVILHHSV